MEPLNLVRDLSIQNISFNPHTHLDISVVPNVSSPLASSPELVIGLKEIVMLLVGISPLRNKELVTVGMLWVPFTVPTTMMSGERGTEKRGKFVYTCGKVDWPDSEKLRVQMILRGKGGAYSYPKIPSIPP